MTDTDMDSASSIGSSQRGSSEDEVVMAEGTAVPGPDEQQNGARDGATVSAPDEVSAHLRKAAELLSRAQSHAELVRVHAEAIRAEAECLRAEAAALLTTARTEVAEATARAESAATETAAVAETLLPILRTEADAVRDEFERMRTEAMSIRRLMRAEVDAGLADAQRTRSEVQRLWAETERLAAQLSLALAGAAGADALPESRVDDYWPRPEPAGASHPPLQSPPDVSEPGRGRSDVTRDDVATETTRPQEWTNGGVLGVIGELRRQSNGRANGLPPAEQRPAGASPTEEPPPLPSPAAGEPVREAPLGPPDANVADLLRQIWDAAAARPTGRAEGSPATAPETAAENEPGLPFAQEDPDAPAPEPGQPSRTEGGEVERAADSRRASQPLIGSGGWRAEHGTAAAADRDPAEAVTPPPPPPVRRRRRLHRG